MRTLAITTFAFAALVCLGPTPAHAWGGKEHVQFTRIAAARLISAADTPPAMKDWLRSLVPTPLDPAGERQFLMTARVGTQTHNAGGGVLAWAMIPDERATNDPKHVKRQPFNQSERLMHFVDVELFLQGDTPRAYRDDLSGKPDIDAIPKNWRDDRFQQAGYLPFAVEHAYRQLVRNIRQERWQPAVDRRSPGPTPADAAAEDVEDSALKWAGYLAHYAQDNTQPHHATVDYKSASYFADKRRAPNVHAEMEWRLVDDEADDFPALREAYWNLFERALRDLDDPVAGEPDPWRATLMVSLRSYDALPLIGRAAAAARVASPEADRFDRIDTAKFFAFRGEVPGLGEISVLELKARQGAWAVKRTETLWKQAWIEATSRR